MLMEAGKVLDGGQDGGVVCFVDQHLSHAVVLRLLQPGRHWRCRGLGRDKKGGSLCTRTHTYIHTVQHMTS